MERSGAAVYLIEAVDTTLVLPVWQASAADTDNYDNWRYLYISQSEYDAGDSLYFWGLALPRDGSELEYQRVFVYIVPQNADIEEHVYFGYAALHDNMFWAA